jgi:hypothetical protein
MSYAQTIETYRSLQPGDRVELTHQVQVGFRTWTTTTVGTVSGKQRRRHGLHFRRNFDDKVFSDTIVLELDDGELTAVTLDEFSELKKLSTGSSDGP